MDKKILKRLKGGSSLYHVNVNYDDEKYLDSLNILNKISQTTRDSYLVKEELKNILNEFIEDGNLETFVFTKQLPTNATYDIGDSIPFDINVSGGKAPYTYKWSDSDNVLDSTTNSINYSVTKSTTLKVEVTDSKQQKITSSLVIIGNQLETFVFTKQLPTNATYDIGDSIPFDINVSGGKAPYTYKWSDLDNVLDSTTNSINYLVTKSTTLKVEVTDSKQQKITSNLVIIGNQLETFVFTKQLPTNATYDIGDSIPFDINVSGGKTPYTYKWSDSDRVLSSTTNSLVYAVLKSTTLKVEVTDSKQQKITSNLVISGNQLETFVFTKQLPTNATYDIGDSIPFDINVSGGKAPYTYKWSDSDVTLSSTTNSINYPITKSTTLKVEVTDSKQQKITSSLGIVGNKLETFVFTKQLPTNATYDVGDSISLDIVVSGGKAPYTYKWSDSDVTLSSTSNLLSYDVTKSTTLKVEVTDSKQQKISSSLNISANIIDPMVFVAQLPTNETYYIGEIITKSVFVSGGKAPYTYKWSDSDNVLDSTTNSISYSVVRSTILKVEVTDSKQQKITSSLNIIGDNTFRYIYPLDESTEIINNSANLEVEVDGGKKPYTYEWSSGEGVVYDSKTNKFSILDITDTFSGVTIISKVTDADGNTITSSTLLYKN